MSRDHLVYITLNKGLIYNYEWSLTNVSRWYNFPLILYVSFPLWLSSGWEDWLQAVNIAEGWQLTVLGAMGGSTETGWFPIPAKLRKSWGTKSCTKKLFPFRMGHSCFFKEQASMYQTLTALYHSKGEDLLFFKTLKNSSYPNLVNKWDDETFPVKNDGQFPRNQYIVTGGDGTSQTLGNGSDVGSSVWLPFWSLWRSSIHPMDHMQSDSPLTSTPHMSRKDHLVQNRLSCK